jgi:hypothetical protein
LCRSKRGTKARCRALYHQQEGYDGAREQTDRDAAAAHGGTGQCRD